MNNISFKIDLSKYPILNNFKNTELTNIINKIIKTGYDIHFPSFNKIEDKIEYNDLLKYLTSIKDELLNNFINIKDDFKDNSLNLEINNKIESLEKSLNKLIGISNNSYKKGNIGENILEELFSQRYGDIIFERKNLTPHSGDAWLFLPDNTTIILESKNYTTTVNKDEITKLENDMKNNNIKWAILVSFNSLIQNMKELDYYTFNHNNETFSIITISNLSQDIHKLDLGLQIIRKLINIFNKEKQFPWVVSNINNHLTQLNNIMHKNYLLRDHYYLMEKNINMSLSNYYIILRDYQYEIQTKINDITKQIQGTMNDSIINFNDNYKIIIEKYKDHKMISLLEKILDIIKNKNYIIKINDNDIDIFKNELNSEIILFKIKIQLKKINIIICDNDNIITFNINKNKENIKNLNYLDNF